MRSKLLMFSLSFVVTVFLILGGAYVAGIKVNTTESIPVGIYKKIDEEIAVGRYILFCPPETEVFRQAKERGYIGAGFCAGGFGLMMKKILAAKGDCISVDKDVIVNGSVVPLSKVRLVDAAGRPLPRLNRNEYVLKENELLLMSDVTDRSFDGRYFGPVEVSQMRAVIKPLIIW